MGNLSQQHNTKVSELYPQLSKKENVYRVLKNGENPYFDAFAVTFDDGKGNLEGLNRE